MVFRNIDLIDDDVDDSHSPGKKVAHLLASELAQHGFAVRWVIEEDWGWVVTIKNTHFPLWIGCGFDPEYEDGHLCFLEPGKPKIRRWFRQIDTTKVLAELAAAIEAIAASTPKTRELRWWSDDEVRLR